MALRPGPSDPRLWVSLGEMVAGTWRAALRGRNAHSDWKLLCGLIERRLNNGVLIDLMETFTPSSY